MTERIDYDIVDDKYIVLRQNAGFFSCCSVRLNSIITFYNRYDRFPEKVDSSYQFRLYKLYTKLEQDITYDYFARENDTDSTPLPPQRKIDYMERYQFSNFKFLDYKGIIPFIQRYFSPSEQVKRAIRDIEDKYKFEYENLCVLFYRGNDKGTEMMLPSYSSFLEKAREQLKKYPQTMFLLQSDETEFLEYMMRELNQCNGDIPPRIIIFNDEIRHMRRQRSSVDKQPDSAKTNYYYSMLFLAITIIMSRARTVICTSGNCSIWIAFYRGSADGLIQFGGK